MEYILFPFIVFIAICIVGVMAQKVRDKRYGKPKQCNCRNCVMSRNPREGYAPCLHGDKDASS